ncbi:MULTISPECIES: methylenetetrahydrofolate reductase [unclassified Enterococcus]|uniref:methylenetetrahydrofolate reductase n=1 Tax=unclassified Enterococcus TaxID=2608891 RepID=UPI001553FCA7|nr:MULTISPECIES: methylenetetrahydrofolate reductase [unclassified Enterococcus]MBS7578007.1 methylenetetrahydrofolate reductase [Enterococcus sp. MMGLQ5-2]MBS7585303.1 methylenetetrahydrofolate reductase [Enterococcus sp. MMGLQ5-1]NPD13160.1 methylenetetrahydrofolate reductase [NAD(P)H] [Enterococcus sp. MMGLQ5-1]NPD37838.1 methylenetetrahydrofolate reductase [NAD(P)H] [Enterococcus sp. MMGLQ5-2]
MKINEIYQKARQEKRPVISLEIFPPKQQNGIETIFQTIDQLTAKPDYISVTYGAAGSLTSSNKTLEIAKRIKTDYGIEALHHLTSIMNSRHEIDHIVAEIKLAGIENILALRGDIPKGVTHFPNDFIYAKELIEEIKQIGDFSIGAACYPEGHIDEKANRENIQHLLEKEQAGADFFISQLFFDNQAFYDLLDARRKARITAPIAAGIMPIMTVSQVEKMIYFGASLPVELIKIIHRYQDSPEDLQKAGLEFAFKQIDELIENGVSGVHVYTMNRPIIANAIMDRYK